MSEQNSESCYMHTNCASEQKKDNTLKVAAFALGTALILSLIAAFNLSRDVKIVTNSEIPYVQQRLDNTTPSLMAEARQKKAGM
ncbi:MAG TPA: hypothetical protein V6C97_28910 [Oculatellaceae cyanobacterium]